jgi:arginyl-tRNA synthetase
MDINSLKESLAALLGVSADSFSYPPDSSLGDLSLATFKIAKEKGVSPVVWSEKTANELNSSADFLKYFEKALAVGPYLNFFWSANYQDEVVKGILDNTSYGRRSSSGRRVVLEFANGNTHKEFHIGHLRNLSFGDSVRLLSEAAGDEVITVSYVNDFGINAAKTVWNWQRQPKYASLPENKGFLLGKCYAEAANLLNEKPELKSEVAEIKKEIENRQGDSYRLWQETRSWSLDYFQYIYKEMGISFVKYFYESEEIDEGREICQELSGRGILKQSEGAIIADLETYGLGVLPVIRSDGTALYPVADFALAKKKFSLYSPDESIYVVDIRQSLYFKQLFKVLELAGYDKPFKHLGYDFVTLPSGMMSSRSGNIVTYDELKKLLLDKLQEETSSRHPDWTAEKISSVSWELAKATIKFEMLKVSADREIVFDIQSASRFDGYTVCYVFYTFARLQSILRKEALEEYTPGLLKEEKEKQLVVKLSKYPEISFSAYLKNDPSEVSKYVFELAQILNDYYHSTNILKDDQASRQARLSLIKAATIVMENSLGLLGIKPLAEM